MTDVTGVVHVGGVVSEDTSSPFTNPEYEAEMVGAAPPYVIEADEAVMTSVAVSTVAVPPW